MDARVIVSAADRVGLRHVAEVARGIAGQGSVEALVLTGGGQVLAPAAASLGDVALDVGGLADTVIACEVGEGVLSGELWSAALVAATAEGERAADAVFLCDAPAAREATARTALRLNAACASMCDAVSRSEDGGLVAQRSVYGGVANAEFALTKSPAVCLLTAAPCEAPPGPAVPVVELRLPEGSGTSVRVVSQDAVEKTVDLAGARIVVSVGRGFARAEDIAIVEPLVAALGAELGCSRPIAEDFKWLPKERLVGLTGSTISADLYLALGISGQVQHLTGIKGVRVVAAVNNDAKAPITRNADFVIQNDLYKVVPALVDALGG